ncbi:MAG TPA: hypothetical protein VK917_05580, partial [Ilumatobacter sp.]|nr:hypothetical protein [Ilumatobacter sp.]
GLRAESNVLRYVPVRRVVAYHDGGQHESLTRLRVAAEVTGAELVESDARSVGARELVASLRSADRVRLLLDPGDALLQALVDAGVWFDATPPCPHGRVELVRWVREQSVSQTVHRHGRLPNAGTPAVPIDFR